MNDVLKPEALGALMARVAALRDLASPLLDPVRLRYAEALASRLSASPPAVQRLLQAKLEDALTALGYGTEEAGQAATQSGAVESAEHASAQRRPRSRAEPASAMPLSQLGQLNQHIHVASRQSAGGSPQAATLARPELKSAVRFRETWARISAETEVDKAANRAPENAGPLNAHNLVLRSLALMRERSPDYLRRFMEHTESLLWLDRAYAQLKQPAGKGKAVKAGSSKKLKTGDSA